jgi:hypothetical protein
MKEIQDLRAALTAKDTLIASLQLHAQQADVYKTQITNLKTQISIFEERFEAIERERDSLREDTMLRGCQQEEQTQYQFTMSSQLKERLYAAE